jgi:uncharacterized protein YukE
MANIQLKHEGVDQAVEAMQQATREMHNALDNLVQGMTPMAQTFTGAAATAWVEFQTAAHQADSGMQGLFGQGSVILADMHEAHIRSDRSGAAVYGG